MRHMSEFGDVLERLLVDPAFKAVLAADPAAALAGYRLSADELELLGSQLSTGDGDDRTVELRSSKSSMFGLLSPLEGLVAGGGGQPAGEAFVATGQPGGGGGDHVPVGSPPHVDADGDGHWDHYVSVRHADGSVDIYEDRNREGLVDFVGHDRNADGIIDSADYDEDFDGVADTHMTDTNG